MTSAALPEFRLETFFERWEFVADYNLTASDAETMTVGELLAVAGREIGDLAALRLGYAPVAGDEDLRVAIASTYEHVTGDDVVAFAGAGEAIFWAMQMVEPGDHAIVTAPCYQSSESVALATGAHVDALPLWRGSGPDLRWTLDLDRLVDLIKPTTRLVAVNFPNNPTGFVPPVAEFEQLVALCDEREIRVVSDEVYRGIERDPGRTLPQAADRSERALSINVLSKAYGLPGLRIGWVACRDRSVLERLARGKHYTSISNPVPSEYLATLALRHADQIRARARSVVETNLPIFQAFFDRFGDLFDWAPPDGGCVAFPRYAGVDGVETFCRRAIQEQGVMLLPASIYASPILDIPSDRFRIGVGRRDPGPALKRLARLMDGLD